MSVHSHRQRLLQSLLAGLLGWFAGFLASAPAMMLVGWRDSEHEPKAFLITTAFGLLAWGLWTLLLGLAAWLFCALPIAMLVRPAWLVGHRFAILLFTAATALVLVLIRMHSFRDLAASRLALRFVLYMPYGTFACFFAVITAWWYIRGLGSVHSNGRALL